MEDTGEEIDSSLGKDQVVTAFCLLSLKMVEGIPESLLIFSPGKYVGMNQQILVGLRSLISSSSAVCC